MSYLWNLSAIQPETQVVMPGETMPAIFWNAVQKRGPNVWMRQKDFGIWRSWSWQQTGDAVSEIAHGLMALGFEAHETASILSNTTVEWVLCDLAVLSAGGVCNGIYPTDAAEQVEYLCADSRTTVLFVEDDEQLDKVLEVRERLPLLKKIIVEDMEGLREVNDPQVMSLAALRELGRGHRQQHPGELAARVAACQPEDLAILVYTSGTTGRPKGAMHSHRGLVYTVRGYNTLIARSEADECMCFLPLCHIAERMGGEYFSLYTGATAELCGEPRHRARERARDRAHGVHRRAARVGEVLLGRDDCAEGIHASCSRRPMPGPSAWAQRIADHGAGKGQTGARRVAEAAVPRCARWLALNNVRKLIGIHRARFLVTGAAPISPELVKLVPGAGCAHAGGVGHDRDLRRRHRRARPTRIKPGSIGPAASLQRGAASTPPTGEILVRGPNVFKGYLNLPEKDRRNHRRRRLAAHG